MSNHVYIWCITKHDLSKLGMVIVRQSNTRNEQREFKGVYFIGGRSPVNTPRCFVLPVN
jgi:hypothetical protein